MASLTRLAQKYRLDVDMEGDRATQTSLRSDKSTGRRQVQYKETWQRGQQIGQGSSSTVWLEVNTSRHTEVRVVKKIWRHPGSSENWEPYREIMAVLVASHPQNNDLFVDFYGWYAKDKELYLVMEYLELGDLDHHLQQHGSLPEDAASQISRQILEGLDVIHGSGFVHRDLKPANILIQHLSPWWVKIADFGISKSVRGVPKTTIMEAGTDGYKAPEVCLAEEAEYSTAADMWSLGCIIYKMLTNTIPFRNGRDTERFQDDPSPFYQQLEDLQDVTNDARAILRGLLVLDPTIRFNVDDASKATWLKLSADSSPPEQPASPSDVTLSHPTQLAPGSRTVPISSMVVQDDSLKDSSTAKDEAYRAMIHDVQNRLLVSGIEAQVTFQKSSSADDSNNKTHIVQITNKNDRIDTIDNTAAVTKRAAFKGTDQEALFHFCEAKEASVIRLLLSSGVRIDTFDERDFTPLMKAAGKGAVDTISMLLELGAFVECANKEKLTALMSASVRGHTEVANLLLDKGARVDSANSKGFTALFYACIGVQKEVAELLLDRGAQANHANDEGLTPLIFASLKGSKEIVELLLSRGAKVDHASHAGLTALRTATHLGYTEIADLLSSSRGARDRRKWRLGWHR